jgi:DNA-binding response OmpR family regulator
MTESLRYKVLVVDDERDVADCVAIWLRKARFAVVTCYSGGEALDKVMDSLPDLVVMDVMLGDADGVDICRRLRFDPRTRHIPIILVSGSRTSEEDTVTALYEGADDYLAKPLTPRNLIARVSAVLRRMQAPQELEDVLHRNGLTLNVSERTARVSGRTVPLTRKEFDLLTLLLRREGKVLSPKYLLETVWGYELEDYNDTHTVEVHVSSLKRKLGRAFAARIVNTVGAGYSFTKSSSGRS